MKNIFFYIACTLLSITQTPAQEYQLLPAESQSNWTGYGELGSFEQTGTIQPKSGNLVLANEDLISGHIVFDMTTISHEDKSLDKHLKAKDFFHTKKYPTAIFEMSKFKDGVLTGKLTIRGITNEVSIPVELKKNKNMLTLVGDATIDRTEFDIKYNSSTYFQDLGSYAIKNEFDLNFEVLFQGK